MSSFDQDINDGILLFVGAAGVAFLFMSVLLALPLIAAGFGGWAFYRWKFKSPAALERQAREHTQALYEAVISRSRTTPESGELEDRVYELMPIDGPDSLVNELLTAAIQLYRAEQFTADIPPPPAICNSIEGARYRDFLSAQSAKLGDPAAARIVEETIHCQTTSRFTR